MNCSWKRPPCSLNEIMQSMNRTLSQPIFNTVMGRRMAKGDGWVAAAADLQDNVGDELQLEEAPLQQNQIMQSMNRTSPAT
jgi:hypothetical protein